ncbi:hypothetical protein [Streptomyces sp. CBMA156]|nr:hypothetical protein [Streptomyces sp. CBMA156]
MTEPTPAHLRELQARVEQLAAEIASAYDELKAQPEPVRSTS